MDFPVFKMVLNPDNDKSGLKIMSLVDQPAIMVDCFKFNKDNPFKFAVQDEEQRIIFGPALIPDLPIYRNFKGKEFFLTIDANTIQEFAIKASKDGILNKFDTNHDGTLLQDITVFEMAVTNPKRFPVAAGFEELPMGTMFWTSKVNNDQTWAKFKTGELNGYSIDAMFDLEPVELLTDKEVNGVIKEILYNL